MQTLRISTPYRVADVLAVRMAALIRKRLGAQLGLAGVGTESTLGASVGLARRRSATGSAIRALPVEPRRRTDNTAPSPLAAAAERALGIAKAARLKPAG